MLKRAALLAVAGILTLGSSLPVLAAEEEIIEPAGYHVYDSTIPGTGLREEPI